MRVKTLVATAGIAALVALAGCGTSDPTSSTTASASATQSVTPGSEVNLDKLKTELTKGMESIKTVHVLVNVGGSTVQNIEGDVDQTDPDNVKSAMKTESGGVTTEVVTVGGVTYASADGGNTWQKTTSTTATQPLSDVEQYLSNVTKAVFTGTAMVNGSEARAYTLTMTMPSSTSPVDYKVWVDDEGRLVRSVLEMDVQGSQVSYNTTLSKFNEPVTITVPTNA